MRSMDSVFDALQRSSFRRRFRLQGRDAEYLFAKGLPAVIEHARDLIHARLAPAQPTNDGKQTPMRGHPVFVAQHAIAACCRGCLQKWHGIPRGRPLTADEEAHVVAAIERWLTQQATVSTPQAQGDLFPE